MNFKFNEDEQKVIDLIHEFGVNEVAPLAAEIDEQERFPEENRKRLAELGMMGICYPKEYGGGGHSYLAYIAVIEELAKHCSTTSVMLSDHHSLGSFPISEFGTEEQKQKYLVPLLKGEKLGAFAVTEPSAGSDLGNQQTSAVDKGDYWLLNGSKIFITNGFYADTYFVTAMTDKSQRSRGISGFIVEKGTPGFTFGTKEEGPKDMLWVWDIALCICSLCLQQAQILHLPLLFLLSLLFLCIQTSNILQELLL